jgi:magnesium-transporting ATPase (P-type)
MSSPILFYAWLINELNHGLIIEERSSGPRTVVNRRYSGPWMFFLGSITLFIFYVVYAIYGVKSDEVVASFLVQVGLAAWDALLVVAEVLETLFIPD